MGEDAATVQTKKNDVGGGGGIQQEEDAAIERGAWGNQLEFVLTCVGYAVGLGNVWRFPYLCFKNGGGAFLIPYFLMLILCGMPVFFMEVSFGQFASLGPLAIWKISPLFKGIGMGMVAVSIFVSLYYNILIAYIIYFFLASMTSVLPWSDCANWWNTYRCITATDVSNDTYKAWHLDFYNMTEQQITTPSEEYYYNKVLEISPGIEEIGGIVWQLALCLLTAWIIVFMVLIKGISSLGKVVYFTSTFPYIMMTVMVIRGCTLEGAGLGIEYYLKPDFSRLTDSVVWSDAASQIFYSLSTCSGGLIAMASYNNFKNNTYTNSIMIPLINCATSFFSGFAIFGVLGYMAELKGVDVADVAASGPGLIFVVYPEGLANMPVAPLWSLLFFFMMLTLGFSSQFSIVECVFVALMDQFPDTLRSTPTRPMIFRGITITIYFLISLPMVCNGGFYIFSICDEYAGGLPRLFIGVLELAAVMYVYGMSRFCEDTAMMIGFKPNIFFRACWAVITPILVTFIIVFKLAQHTGLTLGDYVYPDWAATLGWLMVASVLIWIPVWMLIQWCIDGGKQVLKKSASPTDDWGPAFPEDRRGRYDPHAQAVFAMPRDGSNDNMMELKRRSSALASSAGRGSKRSSVVSTNSALFY